MYHYSQRAAPTLLTHIPGAVSQWRKHQSYLCCILTHWTSTIAHVKAEKPTLLRMCVHFICRIPVQHKCVAVPERYWMCCIAETPVRFGPPIHWALYSLWMYWGGGGILSLGLKLHAYCTLHGNINYNITRVSKFKDRFLVVACGPISPVLFCF